MDSSGVALEEYGGVAPLKLSPITGAHPDRKPRVTRFHQMKCCTAACFDAVSFGRAIAINCAGATSSEY